MPGEVDERKGQDGMSGYEVIRWLERQAQMHAIEYRERNKNCQVER